MVKFLVVLSLVVGCGKKADAPAPPHDEVAAAPSAPQTAAPVAPDAAAPPVAADAASAAPPSSGPPDYMATLCPKVLPKIVECQAEATFVAALTFGATREMKKLDRRLLREVAQWPANMSCSDLAPAYPSPGFTAHWDQLAAVPDALDSCEKLGAAIREAGGLFGGDPGH